MSKKVASSTRVSQAVTHPSTLRARRRFTSVIGREPVLSAWYGRSQLYIVQRGPLIIFGTHPLPQSPVQQENRSSAESCGATRPPDAMQVRSEMALAAATAQQLPHEPWSRTRPMLAHCGHWSRASNSFGIPVPSRCSVSRRASSAAWCDASASGSVLFAWGNELLICAMLCASNWSSAYSYWKIEC